MSARRLSLIFLAAAPPLMLLTAVASVPGGEVVFGLLAVAFPFALIAFGARTDPRGGGPERRRGGLGPLRVPILALLLWFELCFAAMFLLRGHLVESPWLGGLPLATAIQVYGVFLLPMVPVALVYALTFDRFGLRREDLEELRRRFPGQE